MAILLSSRRIYKEIFFGDSKINFKESAVTWKATITSPVVFKARKCRDSVTEAVFGQEIEQTTSTRY